MVQGRNLKKGEKGTGSIKHPKIGFGTGSDKWHGCVRHAALSARHNTMHSALSYTGVNQE